MESSNSKLHLLIASILIFHFATATATSFDFAAAIAAAKAKSASTTAAQTGSKDVGNTAQDMWCKDQFLLAHNKVRQMAGEPPFSWDSKLEEYARHYGEARAAADCGLVHSNGPYGENIFWGGGNGWKASDAVKLWADEKSFYNAAGNSCQNGKMCGHYTQMVWRDSERLGCARVGCKNGDTFAICSYDPPGNYIGEKPFEAHHH